MEKRIENRRSFGVNQKKGYVCPDFKVKVVFLESSVCVGSAYIVVGGTTAAGEPTVDEWIDAYGPFANVDL